MKDKIEKILFPDGNLATNPDTRKTIGYVQKETVDQLVALFNQEVKERVEKLRKNKLNSDSFINATINFGRTYYNQALDDILNNTEKCKCDNAPDELEGIAFTRNPKFKHKLQAYYYRNGKKIKLDKLEWATK